ncbi:hypothetical protein Pelo_3684 [Pelomyxa schiedti]|nr:hypothetical protein Pelo_3684 [Pelomyxa schiedti]
MGESLLECRGLVIMITVIVATLLPRERVTHGQKVDSYYDSTAEMWQFRAQWEVDIADNTTGLWYYSRVCLADTGESVWTTSENKAENQLDMWALGQNYTCWFNPDEVSVWPGGTSLSLEDYAFFWYDPDDMDTYDTFLGVLCLVVACMSFVAMIGCIIFVCACCT